MDDVRELSDIDRALAEALDVDVSPDFAARVRQRIAIEPARVPFWRGWRIAVPAAAAAMALIAAGIAALSTRGVSTPGPLPSRPLALGAMWPALADPARVDRLVSVARRVTPNVSTAPVSTSAKAEPEVLVPREEIEMYRRLIAAAQRVPGAIVVEAPQDVIARGAISDITIDPIKIDLIIPPVSGEGDRQ